MVPYKVPLICHSKSIEFVKKKKRQVTGEKKLALFFFFGKKQRKAKWLRFVMNIPRLRQKLFTFVVMFSKVEKKNKVTESKLLKLLSSDNVFWK